MSDSPLRPFVIAALRKILSPLIRVMMANGITLPAAVELLKRIYIEVAERDFGIDGKPSTDSRLSLLTGVHRRDVKRIRELPADGSDLPPQVSLGAQIVTSWIAQPPWRDPDGRPRPLPRLARQGGCDSFEALVASISQDIRPRSVLDEWLRLGLVRINERDEVELLADAFVPKAGSEAQIAYFGHNLGDHAAAAADNLMGAAPAWFERSVHHSGLSEADVAALRAMAAEQGMALLTRLNDQTTQQDGQPPGAPGTAAGSLRFTCGVYFYSADEAPVNKP